MDINEGDKKKEIVKKEFSYDFIDYKFYGLPDEHIYKQIP
jgi:hypothetical protein